MPIGDREYEVRRDLDICLFIIHYAGNQRVSSVQVQRNRGNSESFSSEVERLLKQEVLA
jgi:hypothetical protein